MARAARPPHPGRHARHLGRAVYPATTPFAFKISFDGSGKLAIGPGRMYVDGLLAENHGDPATAVWDPALAEMSNTPQPPPAAETGAIDYTAQPWYARRGSANRLGGTYPGLSRRLDPCGRLSPGPIV